VYHSILQDTTGFSVFVNEFWDRKQCKEKECVIRGFHPEIHEKVCEAYKKRVSDASTSHGRYICFVG
jgi:hypothetical protein